MGGGGWHVASWLAGWLAGWLAPGALCSLRLQHTSLAVSPKRLLHPPRPASPRCRPPAYPPAGLNLLHELLVMFMGSPAATQFHQAFYTQLVQEIFAVMTGGWVLALRWR